MTRQKPPVISNPWQQLRQFTAARIALGRTGISQPTQPQLAFQLAHARARDAVHLALDVPQLLQDLENAELACSDDCLVLDSAAGDRLHYLQHPASGRRLADTSRERLKNLPRSSPERIHDLAFVVADGLSALAVARHAAPLLSAVKRQIAAKNWSLAPIAVVRQARVAIGDEVGELLGARVVVVLIGERPGLSSPDSLGIYITWMPGPGVTDASRNCISNIRPEGLSYEEAAFKVHYLVAQMLQRRLSGVMLKDESATGGRLPKASGSNFLLEAQAPS